MKGSILFNKDINIEVDVDPSAEEGARLISAKNLVDGQEAGGGGTFYTVSNSEDSTINIGLLVSVDTSMTNGVPAVIEIFAGNSISIPNNYYYFVQKEYTTAEGSVEEVEIDGTQYYLITGDASFLIQD